MSELTEGWAKPGASRNFHYIVVEVRLPGDRASFSLCGSYGFFTAKDRLDPDTGNEEPHRTDCKPCFKMLLRRRLVKPDDSQGKE